MAATLLHIKSKNLEEELIKINKKMYLAHLKSF